MIYGKWFGPPFLLRYALLISAALLPLQVLGQYQFDTWNTDNGLPQNSVLAIVQSRDGYLWLATSDGLVRFDGVRFTIFNKANTKGIKSNRLTALFESNDGALWVGTEEVGVIRYKDGLFTTFNTENGLPDRRVWAFDRDKEGDPLVLTPKGVAQWKDGRFIPYISEDGISNHRVEWAQRMGGLSFYDSSGLHQFKEGNYQTFTSRDGLSSTKFEWINKDQNGTLWAVTKDERLYRLRDGAVKEHQSRGLAARGITRVYQDRRGNIWIGTSEGRLYLLSGDVLTSYQIGQGLSRQSLNTIYEDREGSIWIGADNGLYKIRKQAITAYSDQDGLASNNAYTILETRDGSIWIGTWGRPGVGGLNRFKDGVFSNYSMRDGLSGNLVTALCEDRDGNLWIGIHEGGLNRYAEGRFTVYTKEDGLVDNTILSLQQDRAGAIWIGTPAGVTRYKEGLFRSYTEKDGLIDRKVQVIHEDHGGALWFGTIGGLSRFRDETFTSFREPDGLSSNNIRSIYEDGDGVLWIGTYDGGLNRLQDGKFTSYTSTQGLFNNGVFQILEDSRGNLWMSCNLGIYRVSKKDLNDFAAGKIPRIFSIAYGKKDGLLNLECNGGRQPAGWKTRDGRLWFPTQKGVAVIDAEAIDVNTQPPPVVVEDFILDNQPVAFAGTVQVQPGQTNFEIHYTGLSFITPEHVKFKYKLEGLDKEWVDAGTRRTAYYRYVPPGEYIFTVIAANRDGIWNTKGASLSIVVNPPFWRRWWFVSLTIAMLAGLGIIGYRFRISQLKRAHAAQEAFSRQLIESQENDRKRIAAELHDGLGQSLAIIKNRADLSLTTREDHARAFEQLEEISEAATGALDEVKEIAYNLRPFHLDRLGLTKAIEAMLTKVPRANGLEVTAEIDQIDGVFSKEAEINFYRIVQESVNNIIKHSQATEAGVKIKKDVRELKLRISDNGKGFTPVSPGSNDSPGTGFGLIGIAERVRMLGGDRIIESAPNQGTVIQINISLKDGRHVA